MPIVGGAVRVLGAVRVVGVAGGGEGGVGEGAGGGGGRPGTVRVLGGSEHALAAFKYSLNTYKNL